MLRFVGDRDQKKFTKNPRHFSIQKKFPGKHEKNIHKILLESRQSKTLPWTAEAKDAVREAIRTSSQGRVPKVSEVPLRPFARGRRPKSIHQCCAKGSPTNTLKALWCICIFSLFPLKASFLVYAKPLFCLLRHLSLQS